MPKSHKFILYTYFRSSSSARLRIALNLKEIPYESKPVNLLKEEHLSSEHRNVNPSLTVPVLIVEQGEEAEKNHGPYSDSPSPTSTRFTIPQSVAALEYLDEFDTTDSSRHLLLPSLSASSSSSSSPAEIRAIIRTLSHIIACDVQPVTNLRVLKRVGKPGINISREEWSKGFIEDGFRAYESIAVSTAGEFSVGDSITMADVCLVPAVWGAERVGVDLNHFPTIQRVMERMEVLDAVRKAHWKGQADTPGELRWNDGEK